MEIVAIERFPGMRDLGCVFGTGVIGASVGTMVNCGACG